MAKTIKVGDPVLFYGKNLEVVRIEDRDGVKLAHIVDLAGDAVRAQAREQIVALREEQADATGNTHSALAEQITELSAAASAAIFNVKLRADLLSFWDERDVWVSDGRILTDEQIERFKKMTGQKPLPDGQREVLKMLGG